MEDNSLPVPTQSSYSIAEMRREFVYIQAHIAKARNYTMHSETRVELIAAAKRIETVLELLK